jgi:phenylpropionate dioxygenase-like ring-hydroxylating dioxygenase large terminal subunit
MNTMRVMPTQPYDPKQANYPRQLWWIAGFSSELTVQSLVARKFLGRDVLLSRRADGTAFAIEDRCAHRGVPLSMGWKEGDEIVCRYHGFRYDPAGHVTRVPTQSSCPDFASVQSFPVAERAPFIWIWMGDPEQANVELAPDFPWLRDDAWVWSSRHMRLAANYMLLKENVLDLTHFPFAHKTTFGALDSYETAAKFTYENDEVTFVKEFPNQPLSPIYDHGLELGGRKVDRIDCGTSKSPAEHRFTATINDPQRSKPYLFRFQHLTTPETNSSHHYFWVMARNYGLDPHPAAWFEEVAGEAFQEDREILEAIQRRIDESENPLAMTEISAAADRGGLLARRQLQEFMRREVRAA